AGPAGFGYQPYAGAAPSPGFHAPQEGSNMPPVSLPATAYPKIVDWLRTSVDENPSRAQDANGFKFSTLGKALTDPAVGFQMIKDLNNPEDLRAGDLVSALDRKI